MAETIKLFEFQSENVELILSINKDIYKNNIKMYIYGEVISKNNDIILDTSHNDILLKYKNQKLFWLSYNKWKGLRWENYKNETKYELYSSTQEMKEAYIKQRDFIPLISAYFYDSIKNYKRLKLLFETSIDEIISEENL